MHTQSTRNPHSFPTSEGAPPAFHVMLKPAGASCNLDCRYCFYLSKHVLYPDSRSRMAETLLEDYTRQYIQAHRVPEVTFAWQGGEPSLMGVDFFKKAIELQGKYARPGMRILNAFQTNGTLLDDAWGRFFREHDALVGISIDGPRELHDAYRLDKGGGPTFDRVMRGLEILKKHGVEFNILACVHAANAGHPLEVYRFFQDELGAAFIQFIPIVERNNLAGSQPGEQVTERSVTARAYGDFLSAIFDEWVRRDVGRVFVQIFDVALAAWLGQEPGLCIFRRTCGEAMAMEHNGDLYACDHFVAPPHKLGNITHIPLVEMAGSEQQRRFGQAKLDTLPRYCLDCDVRFACNGGCPKNRILLAPDQEPGLNYLCEGYKAFFQHIDGPMRFMASELRAGRPAANVMVHLVRQEAALRERFAKAARNDPCPCGSGRKFKHCHGQLTHKVTAHDTKQHHHD
jgi:uncharacterized protein